MSEFERYAPDYEDSTLQFSVGDVFVMSPCDNGDWCLYDDVEPIIQRNKELESEIKRLREQEPVGIITDRIIDRGIEWESNFYRYVVIAGIDDCNLYAEPKPAQESPAELVAFANSWQEDDSDMTDYLVGCNDMAHFVKSQLEKMKGKS